MVEAVTSGIIEQLGKIVGSQFVSTNPADLYIYSYDLTPAESHSPDIVVLPQSVEEVQAVLKLANREKIPVIPYIAGGNVGGLTIPLQGGIMLDLKRIVDINILIHYYHQPGGITGC